MKSITLLLGHSTNEHINCTVNSRDLRTPLHFACAIGNLAIAQLLIWVRFNIFRRISISFFFFNKILEQCKLETN